MLLFNKVESLKDIADKIESVTSEQIQVVANEVFDTEKISYLFYV